MIGAILRRPAQAAAEKKIIMRYSHSSAAMVEEPHHTAALDFKKYVEEKTKGRVEVQIYPASQLGGEERAFQDVQQGVIQIASLASNNAAVFAPSLYVIDLPYLFRTNQEGWDILDKYWDELNAKTIKESGNRIIGWLDLGYRHVCNRKRPIRTIHALKGLKIRVPNNPIMIATFRAWGGEPAPMAWDETFNALQQKVVDGQENPHAINRDQKFWEVQKYITNIHYMLWVGPMLVSDPWFRRLDPQTKALVEKAAKEAAAYEWKWSAEQDEIALKECLARGMVINDVSDEPAWTEAARSVWPQFYAKVGGKAVVEGALALMQP